MLNRDPSVNNLQRLLELLDNFKITHKHVQYTLLAFSHHTFSFTPYTFINKL